MDQLGELNKKWNEIYPKYKDKVSIHVVVPGTDDEVVSMKNKHGFLFSVESELRDKLEVHKLFNLTREGINGNAVPIRGYGVIKNGQIVISAEDNHFGENSISIIQEAIDND